MKIKLKKAAKKANLDVQSGDMGISRFSLKGVSKKRLGVIVGIAVLVIVSAAWLSVNFIKDRKDKAKIEESVELQKKEYGVAANEIAKDLGVSESEEQQGNKTPVPKEQTGDYNNLANTSLVAGDFKTAVYAFSKLESTPGYDPNFTFYMDYAAALKGAGNFQEAKLKYEQAKKMVESSNLDNKQQLINQINEELSRI